MLSAMVPSTIPSGEQKVLRWVQKFNCIFFIDFHTLGRYPLFFLEQEVFSFKSRDIEDI